MVDLSSFILIDAYNNVIQLLKFYSVITYPLVTFLELFQEVNKYFVAKLIITRKMSIELKKAGKEKRIPWPYLIEE